MTHRDRFRETLLFGRPDKIPLQPGGARESTLEVWRQQGLPADVDYNVFLLETIGLEPDPSTIHTNPGVSFLMIPQFEEKVLEHRDGHYVVQDWMGAITEISDQYDFTYIRSPRDFVTRKWHKFPVETEADWETMKARYDPASPGRLAADVAEQGARLRREGQVIRIHVSGPFWQLREWLGFENLCMKLIEEPDFIAEMIAFWTDFVARALVPVLERLEPDCVLFSEDMAYKVHSMISPAMVRRFLVPAYQRWVPQIKASGCPVVSVDSDGYIGELIPIWIESGMNCCEPIEVAAGNDIVEYRRLYGKQMAFSGGLDKRAMARGGQTMEAELMRVVPPLLDEGGYLPGCDHGVPPDISWPDFVAYARLLARLTGWL